MKSIILVIRFQGFYILDITEISNRRAGGGGSGVRTVFSLCVGFYLLLLLSTKRISVLHCRE